MAYAVVGHARRLLSNHKLYRGWHRPMFVTPTFLCIIPMKVLCHPGFFYSSSRRRPGSRPTETRSCPAGKSPLHIPGGPKNEIFWGGFEGGTGRTGGVVIVHTHHRRCRCNYPVAFHAPPLLDKKGTVCIRRNFVGVTAKNTL